jgi:GH24 family phage-related lysozyme (muramidase)
MAGPLDARVEIVGKYGSFRSSKKALNAPLIFLVGGIYVNGKPPGDYMWTDGYGSMTDYNIYNVTTTNNGPVGSAGSKVVNKTGISNGWKECVTYLTTYKITPSKFIIFGFSKGCEGFNHAISAAGGISKFDLVLLAGVWSNAGGGAVSGGVGTVASAIQSAPQKCYYWNSGQDGTVYGLNKITDVCAPNHYIEWKGTHQGQIKKTADWIRENVKVTSTGEAATPSGATAAGTGGTPNPKPETGVTEKPQSKTVTTTTLETTGPGWLKPGKIVADEKGLQFLKRYEGIRYQVYDDKGGKIISSYEQANGYPTIGIGHLIGAGERNFYSKYLGGREKMTEAEVLALKKKDIPRFAKPLNDRLQQPVTQNMFNAMLSLGFNTGMNGGAIKKAIAAVNAKDYEGAATAIKNGPKTSKGVVMSGLEKRRNAEYEMFKEGMPNSQPTAQNTTGPTTTTSSEVVESNGTNEQVATASNDCNDLQKEDAKFKAQESPEGSKIEEVAKDPLPPPKDETPVSLDGKYNHRFYILPTKENKPLTLAEMVDKKQKYYKRYWAWRTDENPGYGIAANENKLVSDDGKPLISALVPYWPPHSGSFDDIKEPTVAGKWLNLIKGQKDIESFLDVPILLNAYDVGVFNDNIGYVFEAGNELHMTLLEKVFLTNKGSQIGIGNAVNTTISDKKNQDSSWREWPKWSGIWVEHCLKKSGYTLYGDISVNINTYHEKLLSGNKLINYPGNKEWKWKDLKAAGIQDLVFKPSRIWQDPANLNSDELLKDTGDIAIFVVDYHIKKDGTLTERGQKLLDKIISLNWKLGVISAVKSHTAQSNQLYAEVLVYLDKTGKIVTFGGNTTPRGADSISGGGPYHIAVKETNFKDFAILAGDNWVNGAVFISNIKSGGDGHRVGGLDSKIYTTTIFKDYYKRIDTEKGKLTGRMYNFLLPYIDQKPAAPAPAKIEPSESNEVKHTKILSTGNQGGKDGFGGMITETREDALAKGLIQKVPGQPNEELRSTAMPDFVAMSAAAKAAGYNISLSSSFRTWQEQVKIWTELKGKPRGWPIRQMDPNNPKDKGMIKNAGIDHSTSGGTPDKVAPPIGYHAKAAGTYREGSYHQRGRAIDFSGVIGKNAKGQDIRSTGATAKDLGQTYQKYLDNNQAPNQKWVRKNGMKWNWMGYYNEIWHFNYHYDNTGGTV